MKDDERQFLIDFYRRRKNTRLWPRDLINEPGFVMPHKRAWYILEKWSNKDWYNYGTTLDLGWLTEKGIEVAEGLMGKVEE